MGKIQANAGTDSQLIRAVVTRADGTVEDLGIVSYWNKNPLKRLWFAIKKNCLGKVK